LSEAKPIKFTQADDGFRKGSTHPTSYELRFPDAVQREAVHR
jgi:hypothetical protein